MIFVKFENKEKQTTQSLYVSILTHALNGHGSQLNMMKRIEFSLDL